MPNYLAVTIGPIGRTLGPLRKTRAIFAGSYLFSYVMRELLRALSVGEHQLQGKLLLPYVPNDKMEEYFASTQGIGVGLYPDRLLAEAAEGDFERFVSARKLVLEKVAALGLSTDFTNQYFQIYGTVLTLDQNDDTVNALNRLLDQLEMRQQWVSKGNPDGLTQYLSKANAIMLDAFGDGNRIFPSLPAIATRGLREGTRKERKAYFEAVENEDDENELIPSLKKEFGERFRFYHKYIAIVYADGDRMGKHIGNQNADSAKLNDVSKNLFDFGQAAKGVIVSYGGSPVYIGGDDLFFFAPVAVVEEGKTKTIFDCIADLDVAFEAQFPKSDGNPTLSYGVSITYHKYPLNEARSKAEELLYTAKDTDRHTAKNAIEWNVNKHSGSFFGAGLDKDQPYFKTFKTLLSQRTEADANWLNSVIYFVRYWSELFPKLTEVEIQNLFKSRLNESVHREDQVFLYETLPAFISQVHAAFPDRANDGNTLIFGVLRFIQFIRSDDQDE
jgi:CRISPR-associated protein Cmr2